MVKRIGEGALSEPGEVRLSRGLLWNEIKKWRLSSLIQFERITKDSTVTSKNDRILLWLLSLLRDIARGHRPFLPRPPPPSQFYLKSIGPPLQEGQTALSLLLTNRLSETTFTACSQCQARRPIQMPLACANDPANEFHAKQSSQRQRGNEATAVTVSSILSSSISILILFLNR